jgi:hypothetical protein
MQLQSALVLKNPGEGVEFAAIREVAMRLKDVGGMVYCSP